MQQGCSITFPKLWTLGRFRKAEKKKSTREVVIKLQTSDILVLPAPGASAAFDSGPSVRESDCLVRSAPACRGTSRTVRARGLLRGITCGLLGGTACSLVRGFSRGLPRCVSRDLQHRCFRLLAHK